MHVDRLVSIMAAGHLYCDADFTSGPQAGTGIGMPSIKHRRLQRTLVSHANCKR
ncbi:MAG TPA: DarT ssDNA thymidine ADP-ribosyltransferase family protein [Burkholderiaceae bacterium]